MKIEANNGGSEKAHKLLHDLRNRLNNIAMNAELAKLEMGSLDPNAPAALSSSGAEVLSCLTSILVACKEGADVVDAIAELSLPDAS